MTAEEAFEKAQKDFDKPFSDPCNKCRKWPPSYEPHTVVFHPNGTHIRLSYQCDEGHRWSRWERYETRILADGPRKGKRQGMWLPSRKPKSFNEPAKLKTRILTQT